MTPQTQGVSGYYVWEQPDQAVVVHMRLDVVDQLAAGVKHGSTPKGREVGGLLLGTIQKGFPRVVRVEDFEPVPCQYRRGSSYVFTEEDGLAFEDACQRWEPDASPACYAVGYFRSNTRDDFSLTIEDIALLDYFPAGPPDLALLIRPDAGNLGLGGFFVREHGVFPETTPLEFSMSSGELAGKEEPPRRSMMDRLLHLHDVEPPLPGEGHPREASVGPMESTPSPVSESPYTLAFLTGSLTRNGWVWISLSAVFLLLGAVLGFQAALTMGARVPVTASPGYSLSLSVTRNGDNLNVKWDRQSPVIRQSQKGTLEIEDGGYTKPVDLDAPVLQNGTLIYRNTSKTVRFRLTVYPEARVSITESFQWKE